MQQVGVTYRKRLNLVRKAAAGAVHPLVERVYSDAAAVLRAGNGVNYLPNIKHRADKGLRKF